jgi:protein tyrosine phosphatase (PTP) superfamily phosphohydrolase (DUF442 family)
MLKEILIAEFIHPQLVTGDIREISNMNLKLLICNKKNRERKIVLVK